MDQITSRQEEKRDRAFRSFILGLAIKELRSFLRLTQAEMARLFGASRSLYSQWECHSFIIPDYVIQIYVDIVGSPSFISDCKNFAEISQQKEWNGVELEEVKTKLSLSGAAMARKLGVSRMCYSLWRRGITKPRNKRQQIIGVLEEIN